jgi:dihydrofolate synthase / folylpolyglutamate synthase
MFHCEFGEDGNRGGAGPRLGLVYDVALSHPSTARDAAHDWLMGRINFERSAVVYQERQLKLDRMRQLLTRLGQPDAGLKIIHVAGTKGKGSTAVMISAMLTAAGYRTGLFSSPHLHRIEERFMVDGVPCKEAEFVALVDRLRPIVRAMDDEAIADGDPTDGPTYFELTTAMALLYFVERQVDAAVLEVGLGGRLDSTNVCLPALSVITSISFAHTKQLGNTLGAIAREKAGIIKHGVPVVCGVRDTEPLEVISTIAREHGCRLIQIGNDFEFRYYASGADEPARHSVFKPTIDFEYRIAGQEFNLWNAGLAMRGAHQAANAAVGLAAIAELRHQRWLISEDAMRLGLSRAVLPGRVEIVAATPTVVLDTAHNPASARALVAALAELPAHAPRTLVFSASHDKDVNSIVRELAPHFDRFVVTEYQENPRAVAADQLAAIVRAAASDRGASVLVYPTPHEAWQHVRETATADELICITGSFYLVAELRQLVLADVPSTPIGR